VNSFFGLSRLEFLNAACGIHYFFISSIKRVTVATDFNSYFFFRGSNRKNLAAGTGDRCVQIKLWMNVFLHGVVKNGITPSELNTIEIMLKFTL